MAHVETVTRGDRCVSAGDAREQKRSQRTETVGIRASDENSDKLIIPTQSLWSETCFAIKCNQISQDSS